ncbi:SMI1/KNR4 family protein [Streptomyces alboflavus]|uniref:SMI1/KNR4 family protein n=1 Tax=Streptomyces alboflavus TaxID=67267 RepID=UPI00368AFC68
MVSSITESWSCIEAWLAQNAPGTFAGLEPPAERSAIAAAERAIGLPLPEPLRESLLRHNGTGYHGVLPPFWELRSVQTLVEDWARRVEINRDEFADPEPSDPEEEHGPWWHRLWIPFAGNGCGDFLIIDQRQYRRRGRIGHADHETGCFFWSHPRWASLSALMEATAIALETGEMDGYIPVTDDEGDLEWESTDE